MFTDSWKVNLQDGAGHQLLYGCRCPFQLLMLPISSCRPPALASEFTEYRPLTYNCCILALAGVAAGDQRGNRERGGLGPTPSSRWRPTAPCTSCARWATSSASMTRTPPRSSSVRGAPVTPSCRTIRALNGSRLQSLEWLPTLLTCLDLIMHLGLRYG